MHIGGVNPVLSGVIPSAAYDSWLTVGITQGDDSSAISQIGIDFESWTEAAGLTVRDGAVFWMAPDDAMPAVNSSTVVGQITVRHGTSGTITMGMGGR